VLSVFIDIEAYRPDSPGSWVLWVASLAGVFLTLPYLLYIIIVAVVPDIDRLKHLKLRVALFGIILVTAIACFLIGKNHPLFLTCENFKVGGHDMPRNCRDADGATR
jgi:Sec-independent protein secretion pathway component TatC